MNHHKLDTSSLLASLRLILAGVRHPSRLGALGLGALAPLAAVANPTGGQVVGGAATISTPSANSTVINQSSQRAVINWQQFSVGSNQYVQFLQPNSSAVVLNRVIGSDPSSIFGNITANGQVFLVNPNGILFGPGAVLDVSGLVASTQDLAVPDFMAGKLSFIKGSSAPDATVINQGTISAPGGYVVLAGDYVENDGVINAEGGRVLLAAGGSTTLTLDNDQLVSYTIDSATLAKLAGVSNAGSITADGGTVVMTADVANALTAGAVNNTGLITAHSIQSRDGVIVLSARGADIDNSGTLDASATDAGVGGGDVILHGNKDTKLTPTSVIDAEGEGATGGFVDVSGHDISLRGRVNVGKDGTLLLDPTKLFITDGSTAGASITSGDYVGAKFIQNELNANATVVLVASNSIVAGVPLGLPSTVHAATNITTAATGKGNLTIKTGTLTLHSGATPSGSLIGFSPNKCGNGVCTPRSGTPTTAYAFTATSGTISLSGVNINIKGAFTASANQGTVNLGTVQAGTVTIKGGTINLNGNVTASAGKLSVSAKRGPASPATITVASSKVLTGNSVAISASGSYGGKVTTGDIHATGGSLVIGARGTGATKIYKITTGNLTATGAVQVLGNGSVGTVSVGNVTVGNGVLISGSAGGVGKALVKIGNVHATGGPVGVTLQQHGHSGSLRVGSVSAGAVSVSLNARDSVGGGNVTIGNVAAAKSVKLVTNDGGVIAFGNINASGKFGGSTSIKSDAVYISDTTIPGSVHEATGSKITATTGGVKILGGGVALGAVSAGGSLSIKVHKNLAVSAITAGALKAKSVNIQASGSYGGKLTAGDITATGGNAAIHVANTGSLPSSAMVTTLGNITAAGSASVAISNVAAGNLDVTVGSISAKTVKLNLQETVGSLNLTGTGNLALSGTGITLHAAKKVVVRAAGNLSLTNIAQSDLGMSASAGGNLTYASAGVLNLGTMHFKAGKALNLTAGSGLQLKGAHLAGSAVNLNVTGNVSNGGTAASIAGGPGGVSIKATGNVVLGGDTLRVSGGPGGLVSAGGSVDLTGATVTGTNWYLIAKTDVVLSTVNINVGGLYAQAGGSIHNGGGPGTITAAGVNLIAGTNINLSSTQLNIGTALAPLPPGTANRTAPALLITELQALGLAPAVNYPNGAFFANGNLSLGGLKMLGSYLALQASNISILGPVSVAPKTVIQVSPVSNTTPGDIEDLPAASAGAPSSTAFMLSNSSFLSLFPGATIVFGNDNYTGEVTLGAQGEFTLANGTNLIIDTNTPGTVTGLTKVSGTGIVVWLETLLGPPVPPVTADEVDPTAGSGTNTGLGDQTDKRKIGGGGDEGGSNQPAGTVSQDSGNASVCH